MATWLVADTSTPLPLSLSPSLSHSMGCIPQLLLLASLTDFPTSKVNVWPGLGYRFIGYFG